MRTIKKSSVQAGSDQSRWRLEIAAENLPALWLRTRGSAGLLCLPFGPRRKGLSIQDTAALTLFNEAVQHYAAALALTPCAWIYVGPPRLEPLTPTSPEWTKHWTHNHHTCSVRLTVT